MGRIEMGSQLPYPPPPQPQAHAYYSCPPQPQLAVIYPRPQINNVNSAVQIPPQYQQNSPKIGSWQTNAAATRMPAQFLPMHSSAPIKAVPPGSWATGPAFLIAWRKIQPTEDSRFPTPSAPPCPPPLPPGPQPSHSTVKSKPSNPPITAPIIPDSHSPVPWSTGLCDCCNDCHTCCLTCWCPCVAFGRIAEIVDRGSTSCGVSAALYMVIMCVTGCCCIYSCFYRSKLRGQYLLKESPCTDCCVHCCCQQCALCQESRELKSRGFDISIGWYGNMERNKRTAAKPPSIEDGMVR